MSPRVKKVNYEVFKALLENFLDSEHPSKTKAGYFLLAKQIERSA